MFILAMGLVSGVLSGVLLAIINAAVAIAVSSEEVNRYFFLMFLIIDGSTQGKERSKLIWFIQEVAKHKDTRVDASWVS